MISRPSISKKSVKMILIVLAVVAFIGFLVVLFRSSTNSSSKNSKDLSASDQRYALPPAKATTVLNREFSFTLKNEKGVEIGKIKYILENAELRDQIVVNGKRATSVKGRTFLIINLKIVNDFEKAIELNSKDYIRLSVNGNDTELLAPDIHNDPVTIQAISTKFSRVGFPINDTDTKLNLKVGEINGEKQTIAINF